MALKRAKHNLSHYVLQSLNMGQLVPIGVQEVLPGDTFRMHSNALLRVAPLVTPVMHPVDVVIHHWYCPNRIVWPEFEQFITGGENGTTTPVFPTITSPVGGWPVGSLADYMGLPTGVAGLSVSALPFRMQALTYNHYYRDEQLQTPLVVSKASGADTTTSTALQSVGWGKDYFTGSRPEPQLGPDTYLPLGTSAPVTGIGVDQTQAPMSPNQPVKQTGGTTTYAQGYSASLRLQSATSGGNPTVFADLTQATAVTINDLRKASAIQRFQERMNRSGARYDEYLMGLGIKSSDARLQLPEYLGGGTNVIQFSEVLQTAEGTDPVGEMRGHGIAVMSSNSFERFFEEHGYIISYMYIRPRTMYSQGIPRTWNRRTKFDFWQREFQHIGDQEVLNKELYADGTAADNSVFGFTPRYDEYRRMFSRIAGEMRTVLDTWHMGRIFGSRPALNADFIKANPTDRVYASAVNDVIYAYIKHICVAQRLVAKRGTSFLS